MKIYEGRRTDDGVVVTVNGRALNPRLDLHKHSPTGFEWGYGGSGPAQLALALLADALGDDSLACHWHQDFKHIVVSHLNHDHWTLTEDQIRRAVG